MLIVVADRDPAFRRHVERLLDGSELVPLSVAEPASVVEELRDRRAAIVLLGIRGPTLATEELEMLEDLRTLGRHSVVAALEPGADASLLESVLAAGARDALVKPVSADTLLRRLRVSLHHAAAGDRLAGAPRVVLREALDAGSSGRLVIRAQGGGGSVDLHEGHIVWTRSHDESTQLRELLARAELGHDDETLEAVLEEARRTDTHRAEVLARWGYLSGDEGREHVRAQLGEELGILLADARASALFVSTPATREWPWRFELDELDEPTPSRVSQLAPALVDTRVRASFTEDRLALLVERASSLGGAMAVAAVDRTTGMVLQQRGEPAIDAKLIWALLESLRALGAGAREAIAETAQLACIARMVHPEVALVVSFSLRSVSLGLARASLATCEQVL